jgi:HAD superfamily hydrolase (TIGR01459 family)
LLDKPTGWRHVPDKTLLGLAMTDIPMIEHFASIADRYDALICDVWGVLHNGVRVTPSANIALKEARRRGMAVCMLTNAPRSPADIAKFIQQLGGTPDAWDAIISSGGVTRQIMAERGTRPFYHMGPARDRSIFDTLSAAPVDIDAADYVLCTGLVQDETETAEDYRPLLEIAARRKIELICANPDMIVERGHKLIPCAGAIADLYEQMGGKVVWIGKPHPLVYETATREIERILGRKVDKSRILGIGDAIRTDVTGARNFGIDSLFVLDGIHSGDLGGGRDFSAAAVSAFFETAPVRPTYTTVLLAD